MRPSKYKRKNIQKLKSKAYLLHKNGLSTREVGKVVGRSHVWVIKALKEKAKKK